MTRAIGSLTEIADAFDAIVFDQWGVLHDGSTPYPGAPDAVAALAKTGKRLAVLSNSGKRADVNAARIARFGYPVDLFDVVMTSGEAYWRQCVQSPPGPLLAITAHPDDAATWADGAAITFVSDPGHAAAVLLMGLPEGDDGGAARFVLDAARDADLPLICTNPDHASPRAGGQQVGPGALAQAYADAGGDVIWYGKPHAPIFRALRAALDVPADRILMVGDSLQHDITGAARAGWATLFVQGGLYAERFHNAPDPGDQADRLAAECGAPRPDFTLLHVR